MTKLEPNDHGENRWTHKGWEIILRERPEGLLYCLFAPGRDEATWETLSLKDATDHINQDARTRREELPMKTIEINLQGEISHTVTATVAVNVPDDVTDEELNALGSESRELLAATGKWTDGDEVPYGVEEVNNLELSDDLQDYDEADDEAKATIVRGPDGRLVCRPHWDDLDLDEGYMQYLMQVAQEQCKTRGAPRMPASERAFSRLEARSH